VSDLLDSVRTQPPHPESASVLQIIEQTVGKFTIPSNVRITLDMPETLPMLRVDVQQMQQVFRNLVSNGIEAMPAGGTLDIRAVASETANSVTVSVRDSGSGITPDQLEKLFQPLYTTKARGIGLGLVVVKNLTQANGGTVEVQSEPGKGSTFSITLPCNNSAG
jgi:signal transduction histidine kinase